MSTESFGEHIRDRPDAGSDLHVGESDDGRPPKLIGLRNTAQTFGFQNILELQAFWNTNLWKPYADHILNNIVVPERERANARGSTRVRRFGFATVEAFLEEGESSGRGTYSNPFADKTKWEAIDHYCYAMYHLRLYNSTMFDGLFFRKPRLRPHYKLCLVWAMLQVWLYERTPSRIKKREEAACKRQAKEAAEELNN